MSLRELRQHFSICQRQEHSFARSGRTERPDRSGDTVEAILKVARESKADLIAMGIRNAFLPSIHVRTSVAYRVMAASECPVLTCR